jgi:hypothetical protein
MHADYTRTVCMSARSLAAPVNMSHLAVRLMRCGERLNCISDKRTLARVHDNCNNTWLCIYATQAVHYNSPLVPACGSYLATDLIYK